VHPALVSGLLAYAGVAAYTEWLALVERVDHHGLQVLGATLLVAAGSRVTAMRRQLFLAGLTLPTIGLLLGIIRGSPTAALFFAATVAGLGAVTSGLRLLGAVSLALLNGALFSLWIREDVFDPSFYGVPAGLSLLIGTELARPTQPARAQLLRISGLALVYGSVAVQVATAEGSTHALVLFAMGLLAVLWGFWQQQAVFLLAGTAAVILDVVAYLFQRGFARDFIGSFLLVGAGATVLAVAALTARRRATRVPGDQP
jgi:hypothetical protein